SDVYKRIWNNGYLAIPPPLFFSSQAANGDLTDAVNFLTEECVKEPGQEAVAVEPSDCEGSAVGKEQPTNVIDLTPDNKDDLQAVIALSFLESLEVQAVERDANRSMNVDVVFCSLLLHAPWGFMQS
uniref:ubiquitinyl hydrolase 1 n=1 Tax=Terrapene triunguis TaxID=2587831 RepID=A0A674J1E1_9SAUR